MYTVYSDTCMSVDEFKRKFEENINNFRLSIEKLIANVEDLINKGNIEEAYKLWKSESKNILEKMKENLNMLKEEAKTLGLTDDEFKKYIDIFRESIRDISNRLEGLAKKIRDIDRRRGIVLSIDIDRIPLVISSTIESMVEGFRNIFDNIGRIIEDSMKSFERFSMVVSARIRKSDLEIIDDLVTSGIFRSRSEAIAYFIRKGIEASKEWIEKALEQAKKIRELQESIRKELGDLDEE